MATGSSHPKPKKFTKKDGRKIKSERKHLTGKNPLNPKKLVNSTAEELKKESFSLFNFLFGKQIEIFKKKDFWVFFFQAFLVTGVLILFILMLSGVFEIASYGLYPYSDTYTAHSYPQVTDKYVNDSSPLAYAILEKDSSVIVDARSDANRFSPASTAKLMTALIATEYYNPVTILSVQNIKSVEGSRMGLFEGESITVKNLLYGLLLPSGNDAAYVLASHYPGGVKGFVKKMNEKALALKLFNTHFEDPAGYEDTNYTTARELVKLASYAENVPLIQEIVKTRKKIVYDTSGKITHELSNLNELLVISGVTGIKTGFTEEAGGVLTTSYVRNGKTYIIVVMKSVDRFADTRKLLQEIDSIKTLTF